MIKIKTHDNSVEFLNLEVELSFLEIEKFTKKDILIN